MSRSLYGLIIVAVALPMSGCPFSPLVLGTWLFTFDNANNTAAALVLLSGGDTELPNPVPPQANAEFESGYVFMWAVNGSAFTLTQYPEMDANPTPELVAMGTVASRRLIINGSLVGSSVTWTARPL